jgi:lysophospholipase L1-like esterase
MLIKDFIKPTCLLLSLSTVLKISAQSNGVTNWEKEIAAFETADKITPPPKKPIVFTGSSSIRMWQSLNNDFPGKPILNRGFGGSQTDAVIYYADRAIIRYSPKQVVIYIGDNDIAEGKSVDKVVTDLKQLFTAIRENLPKATITFISIKPSPSRWRFIESIKQVNEHSKTYLRTMKRAQYVDIFNPMLAGTGKPKPEHFLSDSLHMTPAGYAVWTSVLRPYLK